MPNSNRRDWLTMFAAAPLAAGYGAQASGGDSKWAKISPRERVRQRYFPNLELTTHEGNKVRFYDDLIKDKLVIINFMYASCEGVCPTVMLNLAKVQQALGDRVGKDIFIYSFTLKPEQDTPEILSDYAKMHGVKPGWLLLTGKPADLEMLRVRLGYTDPDPEIDRDKSSHIGNLRYGNEAMIRWGACPGLSDVDWIVKSILWVDWPDKAQTGKGGQK